MKNADTHTLYQQGDTTPSESVAKYVHEWGLSICKVCGAGESELDDYTCEEYQKVIEGLHSKT